MLNRVLHIAFGIFIRQPLYFFVVAAVSAAAGILVLMIARKKRIPLRTRSIVATSSVPVIWLLGGVNEFVMLGVGGNPIRIDLLGTVALGWLALYFQLPLTLLWLWQAHTLPSKQVTDSARVRG